MQIPSTSPQISFGLTVGPASDPSAVNVTFVEGELGQTNVDAVADAIVTAETRGQSSVEERSPSQAVTIVDYDLDFVRITRSGGNRYHGVFMEDTTITRKSHYFVNDDPQFPIVSLDPINSATALIDTLSRVQKDGKRSVVIDSRECLGLQAILRSFAEQKPCSRSPRDVYHINISTIVSGIVQYLEGLSIRKAEPHVNQIVVVMDAEPFAILREGLSVYGAQFAVDPPEKRLLQERLEELLSKQSALQGLISRIKTFEENRLVGNIAREILAVPLEQLRLLGDEIGQTVNELKRFGEQG